MNKTLVTFMSPSAEPVTKNSSWGSRAMHLTADSCAWNLSLWTLCLISNTKTSPFLPPVMSNWLRGAYRIAEAPLCSWHANDVTKHFFWGKSVSQRAMFLWSAEWPAVMTRLEAPKNVKSLACLEWHWILCNRANKSNVIVYHSLGFYLQRMECSVCWPLARDWDCRRCQWRRICCLAGWNQLESLWRKCPQDADSRSAADGSTPTEWPTRPESQTDLQHWFLLPNRFQLRLSWTHITATLGAKRDVSRLQFYDVWPEIQDWL